MPVLLLPSTMRPCSASSRSFLLGGPDGPACGGSTWTSPALRRSYRARENRGRNKIRITKVSTVSGEPRPGGVYSLVDRWWALLHWLIAEGGRLVW